MKKKLQELEKRIEALEKTKCNCCKQQIVMHQYPYPNFLGGYCRWCNGLIPCGQTHAIC